MTDLNKLYIFRMTHIENIPHILQYGITHRDSPNKNFNYQVIGDSSLIHTRNNFQFPIQKNWETIFRSTFGHVCRCFM